MTTTLSKIEPGGHCRHAWREVVLHVCHPRGALPVGGWSLVVVTVCRPTSSVSTDEKLQGRFSDFWFLAYVDQRVGRVVKHEVTCNWRWNSDQHGKRGLCIQTVQSSAVTDWPEV